MRRPLLKRTIAPTWSVTPGSIPAGMTFSRGTLATQTNADGSLGYAPHNIIKQSADISQAVWTKSNSTVVGQQIVESTANSLHQIYQGISPNTAGPYTIRFKAKGVGRTQVRLYQESGGDSVFTLTGAGTAQALGSNSASITDAGNGWYYCTSSFVATGLFQIYLGPLGPGASAAYAGDGVSGVLIDEFQVNVGPLQPYYPTAAVAFHGLRNLDYSADSTRPGILIEGQATNLLLRSSEFDNATWTKSFSGAVTVSANAVASPRGDMTADILIPGTTSGYHAASQTGNTTAAVHTHSIFAKASGYTKIALRENYVVGHYASFDLSGTGTVISKTGGVGATIKALANGWYLLTLTPVTAASNMGTGVYVLGPGYTTGDPSSFSYAGDGTSGVAVWNAQLELGSAATSPIETTASTATRNADLITYTGTAFSSWFRPSAGTMVCEMAYADISASSAAQSAFSVNDGASNGYLTYKGSAAATQSVYVMGQAASLGNALPSKNKIAVSYTGSKNSSALNGVAGADITQAVATPTQLVIGALSWGGTLYRFAGTIYSWKYYPLALPTAALQALTR